MNPYGKVLRKAELIRSRFQSTDHETDSETGYNNRNARWYDDESFQFLQVDPRAAKYPTLSPYAYVARNPIYYIDKNGKELFIAGDLNRAYNDILSIVPKSYRGAITVGEGNRISVDVSKIPNYSASIRAENAGLDIVMRMAESSKRYELNISNNVTIKWAANTNDNGRVPGRILKSEDGNIRTHDYDLTVQNPVVNASKSIFGKSLPYMRTNPIYEVPLDPKTDGQVTIAPQTDNVMTFDNTMQVKPRASIVFHEMWENYLRTEEGQLFLDAHRAAIEKEKTLSTDDPARDTNCEGQGIPIKR